MKLDCLVCGQDVFAKKVVHVHGARRMVSATGWCRQCGHGVRLRAVYVGGNRVDGEIEVLDPRKKAVPK